MPDRNIILGIWNPASGQSVELFITAHASHKVLGFGRIHFSGGPTVIRLSRCHGAYVWTSRVLGLRVTVK